MKLLAFDTSTQTLGVALHCDGQARVVETEGGAHASDALLPLIMQILAENGIRINDLDAIAFGCGPGAFTGLRTACSVAQGLALGAGLPLISIVTLLAAAEQYRLQCNPSPDTADLVVRLDARMDEWYWAHYQWKDLSWHIRTPACLTQPQELQAYLDQHQPLHLLTMTTPQMTGMLSLAEQAWQKNDLITPEQALPLYLRNKVALTTAERIALHAGKQQGGPA